MDVLANWTWQGGAVALAATLILRASHRMSATTRHNLWWMTLVVVLCLPALAWVSTLSVDPGPGASRALAADVPPGDIAVASAPSAGLRLPEAPAWLVTAFGVLWLFWLTISLTRIVSAYAGLRRIRRAARGFPASREQRLPLWLAVRGGGRGVSLALSADVRAAAVVGLVSPTIAVAPNALDALTDAELDQIIVHEWAHVQRGDAVAKLIQRLVVAVAGLHPAVWWIDRQLNLERETACDDWAIGAAGSGRSLAVSLTKLASLPGRDAAAVLSPSALVASELTVRVTRLLDRRRNISTRATLAVPMVVTAMLAALAVTVAGVELVATAPLPSVDESIATRPDARRERPSTALTPPEPPRLAGGVPEVRSVPPAGSRVRPAGAPVRRQSAPSTRDAGTRPPESADTIGPPVPTHAIGEAVFEPAALPGTTTALPSAAAAMVPPASEAPPLPAKSATPWGAAASAGVTVGKGSQKAAVATAGFFTRLSKSISGAF